MNIIANEFTFPIREGFACHASSLLVLPGDRVLVVYFAGTAEGKDDVRIYSSLREGGLCGVWGEPKVISEDDGVPHWNPVLHRAADGTIHLYSQVGKNCACWKTYIQISTDEGESWSEPRELIEGDESGGRGPVRNKILSTFSGRLIAGGSTEWEEWKGFFDLSDDDGKTWRRTADLTLPELHTEAFVQSGEPIKNKGIIQPTLWEDETGVHALLRSSQGYIYRTDSTDNGETWCDPYRTELPNNNSGIDLDKTDDGRLVLCYTPVAKNWGPRTPLSLAVSTDNGDSWEHLTHLVTAMMPTGFAYPCVRWQDGCLHVTYTWDRKTICYMRLGL